MVGSPIEIRVLAPELLHDFLDFFDSVRFKDHPDWSDCYCHSYHFEGSAEQWNRKNNRAAVIRMISARQMHGYLAYHQDSPVGWCNVNNRNNYQRMIQFKDLIIPDRDKTASIVCFLVQSGYRRQGIATRFLERIENDFRAGGYDWLEAYPGKGDRSEEEHYTGPPALYLSREFEIIRESENYYLVRKSLHGKKEPETSEKQFFSRK